ncbi:uncharacterized protein [Cherax quadricarinatus]|uniref:uncharacterized protein n=1 Tax=Cherax quadricarinatus TaxID=27406 RepID=UPI00387E56D1
MGPIEFSTKVLASKTCSVLALAVVVAAKCITFKELTSGQFEFDTLSCDATCMGVDRAVYGTEVYHEDSDICLSALHIGAISNRGGSFSIIRSTEKPETVDGSTLNRINSQSRDTLTSKAVYKIVKTSPAVTREDLRADVVVVHNSYSGTAHSGTEELSLTCIAQDETTVLTKDSITRWSYTSDGATRKETTVINSQQLVMRISGSNLHALRCLGRSSATDVLAVIPLPTADFHSRTPTVRFSKGTEVTIPLAKRYLTLPDKVYVRRLPDGWPSYPDHQLPLNLGQAKLHYTGVHIVHPDKKNRETNGAYFDVMITECEKGKYGVECSEECPKCLHGGQCHPQTGTCVCPPGFIGDKCQYACLQGKFGAECQLGCDKDTLKFDVTYKGTCYGLVICHPAPYGCSCAPGYTFFDNYKQNPICTRECPSGTFGAHCSETCSWCLNQECNRFSGTCIHGCRPGVICTNAPTMPQVSISSCVRGLRVSWEVITGDFYFLTYQLVGYRSCGGRLSSEPKITLVNASSPQEISNLRPYAIYNVCVVAANSGGHSPQHCVDAVTPPEAPGVKVINLTCSTDYSEISCDLYSSDGCTNYNGPNIYFTVTIETHITCNNTFHQLSQNVSLFTCPSQKVSVTFSQVLAGQMYQVTAQMHNSVGTGYSPASINVTTPQTKPPPVQNLTSAVRDSNTVQMFWNDPCPSNGAITGYYSNYDGKRLGPVKCTTSLVFDRCHTISQLSTEKNYTFQVEVINSFGKSEATAASIELRMRQPSAPESIASLRGPLQVVLFIHLPTDPGGVLRNCTLSLGKRNQSCTEHANQSSPINCKFKGLEPGKTYDAEAFCCNAKFCGKKLTQQVATSPLKPEIASSPVVVKKTKTTITIRMPFLITHGDGQSFIAVVVHQTDKVIQNITAETLRVFENHWADWSVRRYTEHIHKPQTTQSRQFGTKTTLDCWSFGSGNGETVYLLLLVPFKNSSLSFVFSQFISTE